MSIHLEQEVADYSARRMRLATAITDYADWLDRQHGIDAERTLRLADTASSLRQDKLVVAFVAEFSRGKTELINALFFADHGQRLLPSDAGRTTMCPTELYASADEPPSLRLLPIETRRRSESLARLKHMPIEWCRVLLDPIDPRQLQESLKKLTETKSMAAADAIEMGLWDSEDPGERHLLRDDGTVEVPAWRYGMVNYPHPLLQAGLTILDTPGLNALGAEPELTLSVIPSAHAVMYLLATDTGVTRSDLEIWQKHVHRHANYHVAVLNKIDMLWDELKSDSEVQATIERQAEETARVLKLPRSRVFAVSAQKALVATIRGDAALRVRSGIESLEYLLAHQVIPARRDMLYHAVSHEVVSLLDESQVDLSARLKRSSDELIQLSQLSGKNRELIEQTRASLQQEKDGYDVIADQFRVTRKMVQGQGDHLLSHLSEETLDTILKAGREATEGSWTTRGLTSGIRQLSVQMGARFQQAAQLADSMLDTLDQAYIRFHRQHNLPKMQVPRLDLGAYRNRLEMLTRETEAFCKDPANLMLEKRFMIRRFYAGLAEESRKAFRLARVEAERWLRITLDPIMTRIREHKQYLDTRLASLQRILENMGTLHSRMAQVKQEIGELRQDKLELERLAEQLVV
ncbi:MAG: dynamin family protein [Gammaproteobacteria bacterium]|nr:dynamin family protein [Gammaproteobacteria bacterium]